MTKKLLLMTVAAMALLLALPEEANAQYYRPARPQFGYRHRPHGYIGGQLMGLAVANQTNSEYSYLGHGGGGGLFGGFRMSPYFAIEGNWTVSYHGDQFADNSPYYDAVQSFYVMTFTADAKIFIPTFGPIEPYFQAGIGYAYTGATYNDSWGNNNSAVWASGPTFRVGGGLDFYLGRNISFGGRLLYNGYYFSPTDQPNVDSNFISGVSLDVNVAFHF